MTKIDTSQAIPLVLPATQEWVDGRVVDRKTPVPDALRHSPLLAVPEGLKAVRAFPSPMVVLSVFGPARKGKSYLLSKFLHDAGVPGNVFFSTGSTHDAVTFGLWIWPRPLTWTVRGKKVSVLLIDTEGLDHISADSRRDHAIGALTILLSSLTIYNLFGTINSSNVNMVHYFARLAQGLGQVVDGSDHGEADADPPADGKEREEEEGPPLWLPRLLWLIRDKTHNWPMRNGRRMTGTEFLRENLEVQGEAGQRAFREVLYFFQPQVASMHPPMTEKKVVEELDLAGKLPTVFLNDLARVIQLCKGLAAYKVSINNDPVDGPMLCELLTRWISGMGQEGRLPEFSSVWEGAVHASSMAFATEAVHRFRTQLTEFLACRRPRWQLYGKALREAMAIVSEFHRRYALLGVDASQSVQSLMASLGSLDDAMEPKGGVLLEAEVERQKSVGPWLHGQERNCLDALQRCIDMLVRQEGATLLDLEAAGTDAVKEFARDHRDYQPEVTKVVESLEAAVRDIQRSAAQQLGLNIEARLLELEKLQSKARVEAAKVQVLEQKVERAKLTQQMEQSYLATAKAAADEYRAKMETLREERERTNRELEDRRQAEHARFMAEEARLQDTISEERRQAASDLAKLGQEEARRAREVRNRIGS